MLFEFNIMQIKQGKIEAKKPSLLLVGSGLGSVSFVERFKKDWDNAEDAFTRSEDILKKINTPLNAGQLYLDWGLMYDMKKDRKKAKEYLKKAVKIFKEIGAERYLEKSEKLLSKMK